MSEKPSFCDIGEHGATINIFWSEQSHAFEWYVWLFGNGYRYVDGIGSISGNADNIDVAIEQAKAAASLIGIDPQDIDISIGSPIERRLVSVADGPAEMEEVL